MIDNIGGGDLIFLLFLAFANATIHMKKPCQILPAILCDHQDKACKGEKVKRVCPITLKKHDIRVSCDVEKKHTDGFHAGHQQSSEITCGHFCLKLWILIRLWQRLQMD